METKRNKRQRANKVEFKLNEPAKKIPGGSTRQSVKINITRHPEVARRMRLNRLLLIHDPEVAEKNLAQIKPADLPLLRRMATEGALGQNEPVLRRNAIAALGNFPTPDTLNLLTDLARYGEDAYVRGAALTALADTGVTLTVPLILEGLDAKEPIEVRRAQQALCRIGANLGTGRIREAVIKERKRSVRTLAGEVLDGLEGRKRLVRRRRRPTSGD